jgi:hypothetical protein
MPVQAHAGSQDRRVLNTPAGRQLLGLFDARTQARPWRLGSQPFPLLVLEAAEPGVPVDDYVGELERAAAEAGIPHIVPVPAPGTDPDTAPEIALLDAMTNEGAWNGLRHGFGRFRFPRSDLVRSFEKATERSREKNAAHPGSTTPMDEWKDTAVLLSWSRRPFRAPVWWSTVILLVAAILGGVAQALADKIRIGILLLTSLALLVAVILAAGLTTRTIWLPILSRAGAGTRYRWFATSSFFAVLGGHGFDDRLRRVLDRPQWADTAEFGLQMKTLAFLEDLRAAHRKLSPTLRGLKRPVPPVVFLRGVTADNGGVELLSAMSDIRSRRSELHPLLVVASAGYEHRAALDDLAVAPAPGPLQDLYDAWEASLGTAQAPSQQVAGPWLLRLPIPAEAPDSLSPSRLSPRRRPGWTWLWSWWSLLLVLAVTAVGGSYLHGRLSSAHCSVRFPFSANVDTRLEDDTAGSRECVGVSTDGVRFERGVPSTGLDGDRRAPGPRHTGGELTLADLQHMIDEEDASVVRGHAPYVTVLYVGMLTTADGQEQSAVSSIRELAGAYLAQLANNHTDQPGEVGMPLKVRLLAVNAGQNMAFSGLVADRILAIARRDPTVVGVVGMGRNTSASQAAIRRLNDAGLAIVDPVNSSDQLPMLAHYYGLAATDHDEAVAARRALGGHPVGRALIVSRSPGPAQEYSSELAADAQEALRPRQPDPLTYDGTDDIAGKVKTACENSLGHPYDLVYFAGRAEDLPGLINGLSSGGCADRPLTLIGGDEVARASFGSGRHQILLPPTLTVYYTTFNHLPNLVAGGRDRTNAFFLLARNVLGIVPGPLLADGQMALTYDSTSALAQAAQKAFNTLGLTVRDRERTAGSSVVTSGSVLLELPLLRANEGASGTIDFTGDQHTLNGSGHRGLTLVKVTIKQGQPVYQPICGRLNGDLPVSGLSACP